MAFCSRKDLLIAPHCSVRVVNGQAGFSRGRPSSNQIGSWSLGKGSLARRTGTDYWELSRAIPERPRTHISDTLGPKYTYRKHLEAKAYPIGVHGPSAYEGAMLYGWGLLGLVVWVGSPFQGSHGSYDESYSPLASQRAHVGIWTLALKGLSYHDAVVYVCTIMVFGLFGHEPTALHVILFHQVATNSMGASSRSVGTLEPDFMGSTTNPLYTPAKVPLSR